MFMADGLPKGNARSDALYTLAAAVHEYARSLAVGRRIDSSATFREETTGCRRPQRRCNRRRETTAWSLWLEHVFCFCYTSGLTATEWLMRQGWQVEGFWALMGVPDARQVRYHVCPGLVLTIRSVCVCLQAPLPSLTVYLFVAEEDT